MFLDNVEPGRAPSVQVTEGRYGRMLSITRDQYMGHALRYYGEYSESEVFVWRKLIEPNWIVVDAGANVGAHTVALAGMVPEGVVFAFEPLRFTYYILCGNVALSGRGNILAHNAALGAERGVITVPAVDYAQDGNYGGIALGAVERGNEVPVVALDDLLPAMHFLKADVEGMEKAVLQGAGRLIRECQPVLYLENNPGPQRQELIDYIHGLGYDCWWHYAPHYNWLNWNGKVPHDEEYTRIVSHNMLCVPEGMGTFPDLEKIEKHPGQGDSPVQVVATETKQ